MTTDIDTSGRKNLKFPPICVVCDSDSPNDTISINVTGARTEPLLAEAFSIAISDRTYSTNTYNKIAGIPVCAGCSPKVARYHLMVKIALYTAWIPGLMAFLLLPAPIWARILILLGFVIAPGVFQVIWPPAFGATFLNSKATYEFRSQRCGLEFAKLNGINHEE